MEAKLGIVVYQIEWFDPILLRPNFEVEPELEQVVVVVMRPADHLVGVLSTRLHIEHAIRPVVQ